VQNFYNIANREHIAGAALTLPPDAAAELDAI